MISLFFKTYGHLYPNMIISYRIEWDIYINDFICRIRLFLTTKQMMYKDKLLEANLQNHIEQFNLKNNWHEKIFVESYLEKEKYDFEYSKYRYIINKH